MQIEKKILCSYVKLKKHVIQNIDSRKKASLIEWNCWKIKFKARIYKANLLPFLRRDAEEICTIINIYALHIELDFFT